MNSEDSEQKSGPDADPVESQLQMTREELQRKMERNNRIMITVLLIAVTITLILYFYFFMFRSNIGMGL